MLLFMILKLSNIFYLHCLEDFESNIFCMHFMTNTLEEMNFIIFRANLSLYNK